MRRDRDFTFIWKDKERNQRPIMESPSLQTVYKDSTGFTFHWKYVSKEMSLAIGYASQHEDLDSKWLSG